MLGADYSPLFDEVQHRMLRLPGTRSNNTRTFPGHGVLALPSSTRAAAVVAVRRSGLLLRRSSTLSGGSVVLMMDSDNSAVHRLQAATAAAAAVHMPALAAEGEFALVAPAAVAVAVAPLAVVAQSTISMAFLVDDTMLPQLTEQFAVFWRALEQRFPEFSSGLRVTVTVNSDAPQVLYILSI
jgi:hypothetical protein